MDKLAVAICQMQVTDDKDNNLQKAAQMVNEAARMGACLIVLPEIFNAPYQTDRLADYAESIPGKTTDVLANLAMQNKILLVGGSIPEKDCRGKIYNSSCVFDEGGKIIGKHRKVHLFDIDIPGQISFKESDIFTPGNNITVIEHSGLRFGLMICYDVRFPEFARLATLAGAQLLVIPAAFNLTTGPAHWDLLMRSRAVDNQLFVVAASPARKPDASYQAWGHSMLVDPWGTIINQGDEKEEIVYAELDLSVIDKTRQELPLLEHRRLDIYELSNKKEY